MNDTLTDEPSGPQTDELVEQTPEPRAAEVKVSEEPKSLDDTLRAEVEKAVKGGEEKAEEKPKPETKPKSEPVKDEKAQAEAKEGVAETASEDADGAPDDADRKPESKPTAYREPPRGFDEAARKDWESTPEGVRGAIHRRVKELERGMHEYRQTAEQFEGIREYAELAERSGTDLPTALGKYVAIENKLRQDPVAGLQQVVANLGLTKPDGTPVTLRDVAAHILGQTPDQTASRQEATITRLNQQIEQLQQQIGGFSKHVEQQEQQTKVAAAETEWTAFQREYPRAAELETDIAEALRMQNASAYSSLTERLRHAYAVAEANNPNVAHTDTPPLDQTQPKPRAANPAGQKSVSGTGGESRTVRKMSSDEAIKRAISKLTA